MEYLRALDGTCRGKNKCSFAGHRTPASAPYLPPAHFCGAPCLSFLCVASPQYVQSEEYVILSGDTMREIVEAVQPTDGPSNRQTTKLIKPTPK
jgi:hypothetical protein